MSGDLYKMNSTFNNEPCSDPLPQPSPSPEQINTFQQLPAEVALPQSKIPSPMETNVSCKLPANIVSPQSKTPSPVETSGFQQFPAEPTPTQSQETPPSSSQQSTLHPNPSHQRPHPLNHPQDPPPPPPPPPLCSMYRDWEESVTTSLVKIWNFLHPPGINKSM